MNRAVVLDMVGGAFDEKWIDVPTALELLVEHGHVTRERALAMLCSGQLPADGLTLDEHVARIGDLLDAGDIGAESAVRMLMADADISVRLAGDLLRADVRRRRGDDWIPLRDWDGRWKA